MGPGDDASGNCTSSRLSPSPSYTERRAAVRRLLDFLLVDGHPPITDADLDRGFKAAEAEHRPPARPNEITFGEAVTSALSSDFWRVFGNDTVKISGYSAIPLRPPASKQVHELSHTNRNVSMSERFDQLQKRVGVLEHQVNELLKAKKGGS